MIKNVHFDVDIYTLGTGNAIQGSLHSVVCWSVGTAVINFLGGQDTRQQQRKSRYGSA